MQKERAFLHRYHLFPFPVRAELTQRELGSGRKGPASRPQGENATGPLAAGRKTWRILPDALAPAMPAGR